MSESKHTPGTWKHSGLKSFTGGIPQIEISSDEDSFWIAGVGAPNASPEEAIANANLIASAPAMYSALKAATDSLERIASKIGGNENINDSGTADFYRGYNAVLRGNQKIARESLTEAIAALALAEGRGQ